MQCGTHYLSITYSRLRALRSSSNNIDRFSFVVPIVCLILVVAVAFVGRSVVMIVVEIGFFDNDIASLNARGQ